MNQCEGVGMYKIGSFSGLSRQGS